MQDFGFTDLRVVNDFAAPFEAAQLEAKSAVGAGDVMRNAQRFASLSGAIADCTLVAGTTAIGGRELRQAVLPLWDAKTTIINALAQPAQTSQEEGERANLDLADATETGPQHAATSVALLFGSEKTGLTNEQLSHCSLLVTIPLFAPEGRHLSMNLGQAVAICLYELGREGFESSRAIPVRSADIATSGDRERLTALLLETMQASDYARRFPANARPEIVRQLATSLGDSREEAMTWMGLFKLVLRAVNSSPETLQSRTNEDRPA